jgi:hypothetical protein
LAGCHRRPSTSWFAGYDYSTICGFSPADHLVEAGLAYALLVSYVEADWLVRKAGRGVYDYSGALPAPTR